MPQYDKPETGFYQMRLRSRLGPGGYVPVISVPVRIWYGQPLDPERCGRVLDRSPRWQALVNDQLVEDIWDVWARCCASPISAQEYRFMLRRARWARKHAPEHPAADPCKPVDLLTSPLPF